MIWIWLGLIGLFFAPNPKSKKVKVWFQNRRTKHKRVQQDGEEGPEDQSPDGKTKPRSADGSGGASSSSGGGGGGKSHHQQLMMAGHSIGDEEDDDSDMSCDIELEDSDDPMDHLPRHHHHHHQATWSTQPVGGGPFIFHDLFSSKSTV